MKMMYERYHSELKSRYKQIIDDKEKIEFLIDERRVFKSENTGIEAEPIIQWFTDEIEKVKALNQLVTKPETEQSIGDPKMLSEKVNKLNKLDPFFKLHTLLSVETGEKTEHVYLYNKEDIIEEDNKYYKQDLTHIEGDLYKTNEDEIFRKEIIYTYSKRTAKSKEDFDIVFNREFQNKVDDPQKRDEPKFAEILLKEISEYKNIFSDRKDYSLLRKSTDYFIEYLENKKINLPHEQSNQVLKETRNPSYIYEQSIRVFKKANKEDTKRLGIKEGEEYSIIPEPKDKSELFERFEKHQAQSYFEVIQKLFNNKYGDGNTKIINDELSNIYKFIEEANQLSTTDTFKNGNHS